MAIKKLTAAFGLAEPRGFVRTFIDLGEDMADLLMKFPSKTTFGTYAKMLLDAFPANNRVVFNLQKLAEDSSLHRQDNEPAQSPLTNREL